MVASPPTMTAAAAAKNAVFVLLRSATESRTGAFFEIFFPYPILFTLLATPSAPFSLLHFPVGASPYASGPLSFGPGSLSALAGQVWDTTAISYGPVDGISGVAPVVRLIW
jgi:hypothetical protein